MAESPSPARPERWIGTLLVSTRPPSVEQDDNVKLAVAKLHETFPSFKSNAERYLDYPNGRRLEFTIPEPPNQPIADFRRDSEALANIHRQYGVDIILQKDIVFRKYKRLVIFDMDSTLIEQEVIDEIAAFVGVKAQVAAITERAMNGQLDFSASLRARAALLKGVPSTVFESLKSTITFTPGARDLCKCLKRLGCKLAVLSGGFIPLANWVKDELGLDYAYANTLGLTEDGTQLSGEVLGDIVNAERKQQLLEQIAEREGVHLNQVVAVGDGANDLLMMKSAGLGIAFNAKHAVQLAAPARLNSPTLMDVLYIFGFTNTEQQQLLETV